jgi:hypothetical protein
LKDRGFVPLVGAAPSRPCIDVSNGARISLLSRVWSQSPCAPQTSSDLASWKRSVVVAASRADCGHAAFCRYSFTFTMPIFHIAEVGKNFSHKLVFASKSLNCLVCANSYARPAIRPSCRRKSDRPQLVIYTVPRQRRRSPAQEACEFFGLVAGAGAHRPLRAASDGIGAQ